MEFNDEHTFLCGYQRIRRYGSTQDLNSPQASYRKPLQIITHNVEPSDTLQSLELKYNSSMYEIKRFNRLWSNDSLHCKASISIPIYDPSNPQASQLSSPAGGSAPESRKTSPPVKRNKSLEVVKESESLDDFFKRIDLNVKKTQRAVKRMAKKAS